MISVKSFAVNYFSENTYIIYDKSKEAVIIDCGCIREEERNKISEFIDEKKLTPKRYLCTHLHLDHTFGNKFILEKYGLRPEAHKADVDNLPTIEEQAKIFNLPVQVSNVEVGNFLNYGDVIKFGDSELKVLGVPGHSPGGIAFYCEKGEFVVVGDSLFSGSIGRTDLWGGDEKQLIKSIKKELFTLPENTKVYCGHGPSTKVIKEKLHNPYL